MQTALQLFVAPCKQLYKVKKEWMFIRTESKQDLKLSTKSKIKNNISQDQKGITKNPLFIQTKSK